MIDFINLISLYLGLGNLRVDKIVDLSVKYNTEKNYSNYEIKYYDTSSNKMEVFNNVIKKLKKIWRGSFMNYVIELATIKDIDIILELYSERTKWFKDNNIKQWSKYLINHPKTEFEKAINNKNYYIIKNNDEIVAGFELSTDSKNWNDDITPAYYIYKVVTKVGYRGIGKIIFDKCIEIAKLNGKKYLRLDCLKSNEKLNNIYENHNFKLIKTGHNDYYEYSLRECKIDE